MKRVMVIMLVGGLTGSGGSWAGEHPEHPNKPVPEPKAMKMIHTDTKAVNATVEGQNICLGCLLKAEKGAQAQCGKYGHRHVLKVTSAVSGHTALPEMREWVLHYLENDKAKPLMEGRHEEIVVLKGKVYPEERTIEVEEVVEKAKKAKPPVRPEHPEHPK